MRVVSLFMVLVYLVLATPLQAQKVPPPLPKMAPAPLQADIQLLKKILETNHPSLYWYTSKDSVDSYFQQAIDGIKDSLNELQYRNLVANLVAHIRCGHTTVRFSKAYGKIATLYRYPQFPLALKAWDDSLVVLGSAYPDEKIFKRGTIITSINGMQPTQLFERIFPYISTDGYSENYKSQLISGNFPGWYKTIVGDADSVYQIGYIDSSGNAAVTSIKAFNPLQDTLLSTKMKATEPIVRPSRRAMRKAALLNKRALYIDTSHNTAFMRLSTFTGGRLKAFFRRSFRTIQQLGITNLVIDLRENGGGNVGNSIKLTQYLSNIPFKVGDTVAAISRKFAYGRYIKPKLFYWIAMHFGAKKMEDGWIHYRRYERHYYQPNTSHHYTGKLYLVQGGYTFSAATMLVAQLKGQPHVRVVGEETGGGYYGNSAMHIPTIYLPNTGLQVSLPLYRLVMDRNRPKGGGIMPDITIKPSSQAIKAGIDYKISTIRQLIAADQQPR